MTRRLALTSFIQLIDGSLQQIQVAMLLSIVEIVATREGRPHWSKGADKVQNG